MAKGNNDAGNKNEKESIGSKFAAFFIIILIIIIWLFILALLIKFDAGGIGSKLRPYIEDVQYLNMILPELSDEELAYKNRYQYKNLDEAMKAVNELTEMVDKYSRENSDYAARQKEMQETIDFLTHLEDEYDKFREDKDAFDAYLATNPVAPSAEEYVKWYETMYPENAEKAYLQKLDELAKDESIEQVANYFTKMEAKPAAKILMQYTSDLDFICDILECLKRTAVTDIITAMQKEDPTFAARVTNHMAKRGTFSEG